MASSDAEFEAALADCAREPVHTPGQIQPPGALLAYAAGTGEVLYASENAPEILGLSGLDAVLGADALSLFAQADRHKINNAAPPDRALSQRKFVGALDLASGRHDAHLFSSDGRFVLELEPARTEAVPASLALNELMALQERLESDADDVTLLRSAVRLLRAVSGYDRVMAYRFDAAFNGEVVAESRKASLEPFLGLHFPHWDIPAQARAIMATLPLRCIFDVDHTPIPLRALSPDPAPLDITQANLRGVSPVHLQYLRNMGSRATMTLSLMLEDRLWGVIAFHHGRPRVPPTQTRHLALSFLPFLEKALRLSLTRSELALAAGVRDLRDRLSERFDLGPSLGRAFELCAPDLLEAFDAQGLALVAEEGGFRLGAAPEAAVDGRILAHAPGREPQAFDALAADVAIEETALNGVGGALIIPMPGARTLLIYREALERRINWAGAPDKQVEHVDGAPRLSPRGSFALFCETVRGRSKAWTPHDLELARQVWAIVASADSRVLSERIARQQTMMIDELNHRVRNIIALIRSMARRGRRRHNSVDGYQRALEGRIAALAAAHDVSARAGADALSILEIIRAEAAPFDASGAQLEIRGEDRFLRVDQGPLFALVIHELMTNAAKYGALSQEEGRVTIALSSHEGGFSIQWEERGGPPVAAPRERGFGSVLIEQAVPFELGGRADLSFDPAGLRAELWLPGRVFAATLEEAAATEAGPSAASGAALVDPATALPPALTEGAALVLEDNFVIATDVAEMLWEMGFSDVRSAGTVADALEIVEAETPAIAVLDLHLGGDAGDSLPVARKLQEKGAPFVFLSGYGTRADAPPEMAVVPSLVKPVDAESLRRALRAAFLEAPRSEPGL